MSLRRFINQSKNPILLKAEDTVKEAIVRMIARKTGVVLIMGDRGVEGLFTDRDVMVKVVAAGRDPASTSLSEVMTTDFVKLPDTTPIDQAIQIMGVNKIRHLPIETESGELCGIISLRYLLHDKITELVQELHSLEAYHNDSLGG